MISGPGLWPILETAALGLAYVLYALVFLKFREPSAASRAKAPKIVGGGIIFQSLSYAAAWAFRRPRLDVFTEQGLGLDITLALVSGVLALASVALVAWAKKTLGRQWGLAARVVIGHKLVTSGPFRFVRHPLYVGMAGLLLATVLGLSSLFGAGLAFLFFALGTIVRIRVEENLLKETFGVEFEDYRRRVPGFIPRPGKIF